MSTVKTNNVQIGQSATATNNFTWYQPASPDGTVRLGNGNAGAVTDAVTVTNAGNVGIGTTAPAALLNINGGSKSTQLLLSQGVGFSYQIGRDTADGLLYFYGEQSGANGYVFSGVNGERMRITSSGEILFLTNSVLGIPTGNSVNVGVYTDQGRVLSQKNDSGNLWLSKASGYTDSTFIYFHTAGTLRGNIYYNSGTGQMVYSGTSDYRAKDIIGPVENTGATIDALKVYTGQMHGATMAYPMMVAHEAQEVVPFAVSGEKDAVNEDGTPKYQQMDHAILVPLLIAELQSVRARLAALEAK